MTPQKSRKNNQQLVHKKTTTSYIPLPKLLVDDIKSLQLTSTQKSHCYKFIGILLRDSFQEYRDVTSPTPKPQTYLYKAFDDKYYKWLNILIDNNIVIRSNHYSHTNNVCYNYSVSSSYFSPNLTLDSLCKDKECEPLLTVGYKDIIKTLTISDRGNYKRFEDDILSLDIDYDRLRNIVEKRVNNISIAEFDTNEAIKESIVKIFVPNNKSFFIKTNNAIVKANEKGMSLINDNGKFIIANEIEFINKKKVSINLCYTDVIENLRMNHFWAKRNGTNNRLDTNLTNMCSLLVDDICYQNNLVQIDLKNSQFTILSHILKEELNTRDFILFKTLSVSGKLYDHIATELGLESKEKGKKAMFEIMFSSRKNNTIGKAKIKELFPSVVKWIDDYKKQNGDDFFSIMLQLKESFIFIDEIFNEIKSKKLFCLTKHDSFIVRENDTTQVLKIVKEYFAKIKFEYKLSIDKINDTGTKISCNEINFVEVEITPQIEENEPFVYDLALANKFADDFIANMEKKRNKVIQLEIDKENQTEDVLGCLKIVSENSLENQTEYKHSIAQNQVPANLNTSMRLDKFISNCKYKFGSYVEDRRFDNLKEELEQIWKLEFITDVTEEIKNYINSQIDYPNEDGYFVKLQLLK